MEPTASGKPKTLPANLTAQARELEISTLRLVGDLWPWFLRFAIVSGLAILVSDVWTPNSIPTLILTTLVAAGTYGALMLPLALRDPLGMYVRPRLEKLLNRILRRPDTNETDG